MLWMLDVPGLPTECGAGHVTCAKQADFSGLAVWSSCARPTTCRQRCRCYPVEQERDALALRNSALDTEKTALQERLAHVQTQESTLDARRREREEEARRLQDTCDGLISSLKKELKAGPIEVEHLRAGRHTSSAASDGPDQERGQRFPDR